MAVKVKKITLWRREVEDRPGTLAQTLQPLAGAGADLKVVMGYRFGAKAAIEVSPVSGKRATAAAQQAGLAASTLPALLVEGDNRPGLGHAMAAAIAGSGINIAFLVAQVVGNRFSSVLGFDSNDDASRAAGLIKKAASAGRRKGASRKTTKRRR